MSLFGGLVQRILDLPGWLVLVVAGSVVFAEDALFLGFVLPGNRRHCWPASRRRSATRP